MRVRQTEIARDNEREGGGPKGGEEKEGEREIEK